MALRPAARLVVDDPTREDVYRALESIPMPGDLFLCLILLISGELYETKILSSTQ
jgi:hypothetical protein